MWRKGPLNAMVRVGEPKDTLRWAFYAVRRLNVTFTHLVCERVSTERRCTHHGSNVPKLER
jgi:hypothetical protein